MKRHNDQSIKEVLQQLVEHYRWKGRLHQSRIRELWADRMGTTINQYTREIKIIRRKLYITIDASALKQELHYGRDKIREMVNEELGEDFSEEVVVR